MSKRSLLALVIGCFLVACTFCQTPAGDVPVQAFYTTANCTGEPTFQTMVPTEPGVCTPSGPGTSTIWFANDDHLIIYSAISNPDCDYTRANASYFAVLRPYGVCNHQGTDSKRDGDFSVFGATNSLLRASGAEYRSAMMLRNVNATYSVPQELDWSNPGGLPNYASAASMSACPGPNQCIQTGGQPSEYYQTRYSEVGNCSTAIESYNFPNLRLDRCYFYAGYGYVKHTCPSEEDVSRYNVNLYNDPTCTTLYDARLFRLPCDDASDDSASFCYGYVPPEQPITPTPTPNAPITPTPTPTSSASGLQASILMITIFTLIAAFLF